VTVSSTVTVHSWTINSLTSSLANKSLISLTNVEWLTLLKWTNFQANRIWVTMSYSSSVLFVSVATGSCLPNLCPAMDYSAAIRCSGNMLTEPLPISGHIRHIVPSLRLLVPNSLSVCHRSFFSVVSARDVFLWLGFSCCDYSPAATSAPSLRTFVPSGSLIRFESIQVHHHHPQFFSAPTVEPKLSRLAGSSYANAASRFFFRFGERPTPPQRPVPCFSLRKGPTPPQGPVSHLPQSAGHPGCSPHEL
jgi:hypothetical protein